MGVGPLAPRPAPPVPAPSGLDLATEEPEALPEPDEMEVDLPSASASIAPAMEVDLPAVSGSAAPALEMDLPAVSGSIAPAGELDLPAPAGRSASDFDVADLPAPSPRPRAHGFGEEFELAQATPAGELDFDDLPAPAGTAAPEIDLPSVPPTGRGSGARLGEVDLPAPIAEVPELPAPSPRPRVPSLPAFDEELSAELPVVGGDLPDLTADLPALGGDLPDVAAGLPEPGGELPDLSAELPLIGAQLPEPAAGLPQQAAGLPQQAAGLPQQAAGLPQQAAGLPQQAAGLPQQAAGLPQQGAVLPQRAAGLPAPFGDAGEVLPTSYGEMDLGSSPGGSSGAQDFAAEADEFDAFPTESGPPKRGEVGGDSYGEVAFESTAGGDLALDEEPDRGPVPAPPPAVQAGVEPPGIERPGPRVLPAERRRMSRGAKIGIGAAVALTVAGGALAFLPDVGPYGAYVVLDALSADEHAAVLSTVQTEARAAWSTDTAEGADRAFARAIAAQEGAPRYKPLQAYAAYLGFMRQVRFGRDTATFAQAKVLLDGLESAQPEDVAHLRLARLARDTANGRFGEAKAHGTNDLEAATLVGEAALLAGDGARALEAFTAAARFEDSARTAFGLARAHMRLEQSKEAAEAAQRVIEKNAEHVGARLLLARLRLDDRAHEAALVTDLEAIVSGGKASAGEQVEALNLLGTLHLARSRFTKAEQCFTQALQLQADSIEALRGLGDSLFAGGRFSEALARYEAASKVNADDLLAQLGVVRAQLSLERLEDAVTLLEALQGKYEKSTAVAYWFGRAKELVGERQTALAAYRRAIELNEDSSELVASYVGLTRLLAQDGLAEEAEREVSRALERFPERAELYVAVGDLATAQSKYEHAIAQYDKALALDPDDIGIHFKKGVALRRARNFEAAQQEFEGVAKVDPEFPGLALEWGLLFEASGRAQEALASYESALAKAPEDPDLMLRVGCGKANAGQTDAAVELLRKVLAMRPNSSETNHCLGRALLLGGGDVKEATRYLERAVLLDGNRAEHHLYVGWAANEARDPAKAEQALSRALELDQTLADAYWQRGILRNRQGAVKDALEDLHRAIQMNPSRYEAHASLAEAYFNLGREQEALHHWRIAVTSGPAEPVWRYRYGKLLFDNRQTAAAREQLALAVEGGERMGEKATDKPVWLWEAHRLLALCIGRHRDAIPHWQAYLVNSNSNSPYRAEALRELKALQP